jgi:protein-S-isoprenylcysteine O-methyltransferase Ste14
MKGIIGFMYAIICYAIGFGALLYWIASVGNLLDFASIDGAPEKSFGIAFTINFSLIMIFGLQHSIMARRSFKKWFTQFVPVHIERSTFVLFSGLALALLTWKWQPISGVIWSVPSGSSLYYALYAMFFLGWAILFVSTFLINHFDLFGLRQAYFHMINKTYKPVKFKVVSLYKYVRHPLYFGVFLGIWSTPTMTITHLLLALLLTGYLLVGIAYEEKDLENDFGKDYAAYKNKTPKLIPIPKKQRKKASLVAES